jgi:hypothetical protein
MLGDGEGRAFFEQLAYDDYHRQQAELSALAARRELLKGGMDALARQSLRFNGTCPTPSGNPSRASQFPR